MPDTPRLAYFVSEFPCLSHTFIRREIDALRTRGVDIVTYSGHKSAPDIPGLEVASIFPVSPGKLFTIAFGLLQALVTAPVQLWRTYRLALIHRLPGFRSLLWSHFYFFEAILLAAWLKRDAVTHLHVHFANSSAHIGILVNQLTGIPWSMMLHGACDFEYPAGPLLPDKLKSADFVAFASYYGRSQAMRAVPPTVWEKFHVVRCGVEIDRIRRKPTVPQVTGVRKLYSVGRLSPEKGQSVLLEGFSLISAEFPSLELHLVGDGPSRQDLEALTCRLQLGSQVFFHGAVTEQEVLEHLQHADFLAMGSFMEGIPLALMEAMASGVPVIAPRIAGIPELITDNDSGFLFHPANFADLAAALRKAMGMSAAQTAAMTSRAEARVREEFTVSRSADTLLHILSGLGAVRNTSSLDCPEPRDRLAG